MLYEDTEVGIYSDTLGRHKGFNNIEVTEPVSDSKGFGRESFVVNEGFPTKSFDKDSHFVGSV